MEEDPIIGWGSGVKKVVVGGWGQGVGARGFVHGVLLHTLRNASDRTVPKRRGFEDSGQWSDFTATPTESRTAGAAGIQGPVSAGVSKGADLISDDAGTGNGG